MAAPSRMTKIDAVNEMLKAVGLQPVNTVENSSILEVNLALSTLNNTLREVLEIGWWFNREECFEVVPDGSGEILVPTTALRFDPADPSSPLVERYDSGVAKMYDTDEGTFAVTGTSFEFQVTWSFDFEETPQAFRNYVAARATREFAEDHLGTENVKESVRTSEQEKLSMLEDADADHGDYNMFSQSRSDAEILNRNI